MNVQTEPPCGVCERPTAKATRVEAQVRYCSTCYARCFKRLLCGGCGMFKQLLASKEDPRCQDCIAAMPCVRCRRIGRPVGKITAGGPACNSCASYFSDARPCEMCSSPSRILRVLRTADGDKTACPRCMRVDHRTCALCRKHRLCDEMHDGRWQCKLCRDIGEVPCSTCSLPMPAGMGKRCSSCYWLERCVRSATQLVELLKTKRARDAFAAFAAWLPSQGYVQKAAVGLRKHVQFFELLESTGDEAWTSDFLLKHLGPAMLRKYELPMRWLRAEGGVTLHTQDKAREADGRRVRKASNTMPEGTVGRRLLESFEAELARRRDAGKLTDRSMRLAFRPALVLVALEDADGARAPTQLALERYLTATPGQRAALSTFVGFLKTNCGIELRLPPKRAGSSATARKALEKQITALMAPSVDPASVTKRWAPMALRYFHHLSSTQANEVVAKSVQKEVEGGMVLSCDGQDYWIPSNLSGLAHLGQR
ncbi:hypothetical protein [Roseateles sp.]|uniref:hypothetical protein n=1 Tax=Roseateles sp. TaxID=1971397 RepID=UPI003266A957